jgi:hypothetical protein
MFCDKCGTPFAPGSQYCASCGKPIIAATPVSAGAMSSYPVSPVPLANTRVRRHINVLAALWLANGVLRLLGVGSLMLFRRWFVDWPWASFSPRDFGLDLGHLVWGSVLFGGVTLAILGVVHLVLAWGLYERHPWARPLGIVVACLALIRIPFGTALGIYTLWVLVPEASARDWNALSLTSQANPAR